jgi:hypothetical protein
VGAGSAFVGGIKFDELESGGDEMRAASAAAGTSEGFVGPPGDSYFVVARAGAVDQDDVFGWVFLDRRSPCWGSMRSGPFPPFTIYYGVGVIDVNPTNAETPGCFQPRVSAL